MGSCRFLVWANTDCKENKVANGIVIMEAEIVLDNPSPIRYLAPEQFGNQEISVCPVICKVGSNEKFTKLYIENIDDKLQGNVYTAQLNVLNSRENDVDELIASFDVLKVSCCDVLLSVCAQYRCASNN